MSSRTNPFEMVERMFEQMSQQFDEAARTWGTEGEQLPAAGRPTRMGIDLADRGDEFVVTADMPGFEREDIQLRLLDDTLHVSASQERTSEQEDEAYIRSERSRRSLRERVRIPEPVEEDEITATLKNGVLTVDLPKMELTEAGGRQIDIE